MSNGFDELTAGLSELAKAQRDAVVAMLSDLTDDGFRAIALLPLVDELELDVVSGRARQGQHSVEHVVSYEVRAGKLVEVSQRAVNSNHGGRQIN